MYTGIALGQVSISISPASQWVTANSIRTIKPKGFTVLSFQYTDGRRSFFRPIQFSNLPFYLRQLTLLSEGFALRNISFRKRLKSIYFSPGQIPLVGSYTEVLQLILLHSAAVVYDLIIALAQWLCSPKRGFYIARVRVCWNWGLSNDGNLTSLIRRGLPPVTHGRLPVTSCYLGRPASGCRGAFSQTSIPIVQDSPASIDLILTSSTHGHGAEKIEVSHSVQRLRLIPHICKVISGADREPLLSEMCYLCLLT